MSNSEVIKKLQGHFDSLAQTTPEERIEFWFARDLQEPLGYARWENFLITITRAIESCKTTDCDPNDHFRGVRKMVSLGSGAERSIAEKTLSQNIYERGVDEPGFGRIRSKGDQALFGGHCTQTMKNKYGITESRPLADFLPTLTIAAKNLATEMTNHNVSQDDLQGEVAITDEHIQNNQSVRTMLGQRGIKPENLPPEEDLRKLERRVKSDEKKLIVDSGKLPRS